MPFTARFRPGRAFGARVTVSTSVAFSVLIRSTHRARAAVGGGDAASGCACGGRCATSRCLAPPLEAKAAPLKPPRASPRVRIVVVVNVLAHAFAVYVFA